MKFFIKIFFSASLIISCNQVSSKYVNQINNPEILLNEISEHIKEKGDSQEQKGLRRQ